MGLSVYPPVSGGAGGTGFNLDVDLSNNTTFELPETQPSGRYSITSRSSDSTVEFYFIAQDGTLSGYTATKAITATKDFNKIVVYGASSGDRLSFDYEPTVFPIADGNQDSGAAPYITSVSDADLAQIDDTTIITGGNFATDVTVTFTGTDAILRNPKSVVRTDSTQIVVTRPDDFLQDNSPYTLTVSNPGIPQSAYRAYTTAITAGGDPTWTTSAGPLADAVLNEPYSETLQASDPDGSIITYELISGLLPAGLSLNSATGEISGTPTVVGTENFTISAKDAENNITNRSFSIYAYLPIPTSLELHLDAADPTSYPGSGSTWYDISGNSRNGSLVNTGYSNGYITFNGSNSYVDLGGVGFVGSGNSPLTTELWFYVENSLSANNYVMPIRVKQDTEFFVSLYPPSAEVLDTITVFRGYTQWGNRSILKSDLQGKWVQLVSKYTGGDKDAASSYVTYLNGINLGSGTQNWSGAGGSSNSNVLGMDSNNAGKLAGRMGIYRLYSSALTDAEVISLYNLNKSRYGLS